MSITSTATLPRRPLGRIGACHDPGPYLPAAPADCGSGSEVPTIDAPTAISAGIAGGIARLITAAGFSARRGWGPRPA